MYPIDHWKTCVCLFTMLTQHIVAIISKLQCGSTSRVFMYILC